MSTPSTAPTHRTDTDRDTAPTPTRMGRPPISDIPPGQSTPQRQIRIADEDWYGAAAKAAEVGTTSSAVIRRLLRAWRLGEIDLPE